MASSSAPAQRLVASVVHDWLVGMDVTSSLVLPCIGSQGVGAGCPPTAQLPSRSAKQQQATPLHQRARNEQPRTCASMQKPPRQARQQSLQAVLAKQQEKEAASAAASAATAPGFSLADRLNAAAGAPADTADRRTQVEQTQASSPQGQQQTLRLLRESGPPSSHIFGLPSGQPSWAPSMLLPAAKQPAAAPALATAPAALRPGIGGQPDDRALPHGQQAHPATARGHGHKPAERQLMLSSASGSQGRGRWMGSSQEGAGAAEPARQQGQQANPATAGEQGHPATTGEHMHQPAQRLMALSEANGRLAWGSSPSYAQRSAGAAQPVVEAGHSVAAAPLGARLLEAPASAGRQGQAACSHDMAATADGQGLTADPAFCPAAAAPQSRKRKLTMFTSSSWEPPAKLPACGKQSQDDSGLQRAPPPTLPGAARLSPQRQNRNVNGVQLAAKWPGREQASLQPRSPQALADTAPAGTGGAWQMFWAAELPVAGQKPACTSQQEGSWGVSPAQYQHQPQSAAALVRGLPAAAAAHARAPAAADNGSPSASHGLAYEHGNGRLQQAEQAVEAAMLSAEPCWQGLGQSHSGAAGAGLASKPGAPCRLPQTWHGKMHSQYSLADPWPAGGSGGASFLTPHPAEAASMQAGQYQTPAPRSDSKLGRGATPGMLRRQQHLFPRAHLSVAAGRQGGQLAGQAPHSLPSAASRSGLSQRAPAFAKFACTATLSEREPVCSNHHQLPFTRQHLHGLPEWRSC